MLAVCQQRVEESGLADRVHLCQADMSSFDLPRKDFTFGFIALRSFMHLLTQAEQLACLQRLHEHIRPGGGLVIAVIAPDLERLQQKPMEGFALRRKFGLPNGHHVTRKDRLVDHDPIQQVRSFEFKFEEYDVEGELVRERLIPLQTRYIFRYELELLLKNSGFEVEELYRDYDKHVFDGTGEMIVVARRL
jgi:SAM-dependent methyltransferase